MTTLPSDSAHSRPIRRAVRRLKAHHYLFLLLVSFSTTVIVTRLFLTLTGFPQIGNGELHIAHLLWGGLLLLISTVLMLILTNQWVYSVSAILGGMGVGLFIDEVGKFITRSNDYFYPLAIPIIYAVALVIVVLYLEVRRPESKDERAEMYRALETFKELLDRDLTPHDMSDLQMRLKNITTQGAIPDVTRLAQTLLDFLTVGQVQLAPDRPGLFRRWIASLRKYLSEQVGMEVLRTLLIVGLIVVAVISLYEPLALLFSSLAPTYLQNVLSGLVKAGQLRGERSLDWFVIRLVLEATIGIVLLIAAAFFILGHNKRGSEIGYIGLLLTLTGVNLVVFYFDQFGNIFLTLLELALLLLMLQYRSDLKTIKQTQGANEKRTPDGSLLFADKK